MRVIGLALLLLAIAGEAAAQAPVLKDAERFATRHGRRVERRVLEVIEPAPIVVRRPCCDGYVGSAYGLGKPNYYGISPRPDDGALH